MTKEEVTVRREHKKGKQEYEERTRKGKDYLRRREREVGRQSLENEG